ncbi:purine permease 21-like [Quercus lobata]|uniref:purine permease 21-like n=1 Tax=Quercus lobata TaxID=97700 RepID=UPI001248EA72|nr:purine permease 21-like [Quercus lobata]
MGQAQNLQLQVTVQEAEEANTPGHINATNQSTISQPRTFMQWLRMTIFTLFVLSGQSAAILLGRFYYDKGGKSKWTATLVQIAGFPIIIPYYYISPPEKTTTNSIHRNEPSTLILALIYVSLGVLQAANSMMYTVGLLHLPVSTFALICASQLTFNAFFSFLINSQKFTPFIINSLVLLTISSALLVFQTNSMNPTGNSNVIYEIGLFCTVGASAGFGLMLSLTELSFHKILRRETFTVILEMIIYQSLVATCATLVGLFASGEWKGLKREMDEFELGKFIYVSTLIWTAIAWQIFNIGAVGLIHEVSSLFSNVISVLGLPVIPVLAAIFFHDKMDGVKAISMVLAIWGFISYFYEHYLDDSEAKAEKRDVKEETSMRPLLKEVTDEQDGLKNIYQKIPLSTETKFYEH